MDTSFLIPKDIKQKHIGIIFIDFTFPKKDNTTYEVFVYSKPFNLYEYQTIGESAIQTLCKKDLEKEEALSYIELLKEHFNVTEFDDYTSVES